MTEPARISTYIPSGPRRGRRTVLVAVVEVDRCYGGAEEGGWWYDRTYVVGPVVKCRESRARRVAERLAPMFPKEGRSRYSVIGTPDPEVRVFLPEQFVADSGRQRYE